jgi:hypothetical protein
MAVYVLFEGFEGGGGLWGRVALGVGCFGLQFDPAGRLESAFAVLFPARVGMVFKGFAQVGFGGLI